MPAHFQVHLHSCFCQSFICLKVISFGKNAVFVSLTSPWSVCWFKPNGFSHMINNSMCSYLNELRLCPKTELSFFLIAIWVLKIQWQPATSAEIRAHAHQLKQLMPLYSFCSENSALEAFSPGEWQKIKEVIIRWNGIFTCEPECRRSNSLLHFHARLELFFSSVFPLNLTEAVQFTQKLTFFGFDHEPPIFSPTGSVSVSENG